MNVHIGYLLKNIADKLHGRADANFKKYNLTFQQSKIIGFLSFKNDCASQKEIENFLQVSHPTVVGIVTRMEQNGFLTVCVDETDRRNKIVKLTPKSIELWKSLRHTIEENEKKISKGLTEQQISEFINMLEIIYQNLD